MSEEEEEEKQLSIQERLNEFKRIIIQNQRDIKREINKMEAQEKKIRTEIQRMIRKNEPRSSIQILAQQILRDQAFIKKYELMVAKMDGLAFQLTNIGSTDAQVRIMKAMSEVI
jgi:hypothetical protein